jgi:hypothetical protein
MVDVRGSERRAAGTQAGDRMSRLNTARVLREGRAWERAFIKKGRPRGSMTPFRENMAARQRVPYSLSPSQRRASAAQRVFIEVYENFKFPTSRPQSAISAFRESYRSHNRTGA